MCEVGGGWRWGGQLVGDSAAGPWHTQAQRPIVKRTCTTLRKHEVQTNMGGGYEKVMPTSRLAREGAGMSGTVTQGSRVTTQRLGLAGVSSWTCQQALPCCPPSQ